MDVISQKEEKHSLFFEMILYYDNLKIIV